jgi:hypothetical protein
MLSKFKPGQRVLINWAEGKRTGTIARIEFWVSGFVYWVDVDDLGCKIVNSVMMEPI